MWFLYTIAALVVIIAWYTSPIGREWLKARPWMQWYYRSPFAEKVETVLFSKSETLLDARFKMFLAAIWQFVLMIGAVDPTPFLIFIPQKYHAIVLALPSVIVGIDGAMSEIRRRWTTKPVSIVAVPETTPIPADVAKAVEKFEERKEDAVAVVKEANKEGAM